MARIGIGAATLGVVCAAGVSLGGGTPAHAAGWTQAEGGYYAKVWGRLIAGKGIFTSGGDVVQADDGYRDISSHVYGEYGLTPYLTLVAFGTPFGHASYAGGSGTGYVGSNGGGVRMGRPVGPLRLAMEVRYAYAPEVGDEPVGVGIAEGEPFILQPTVSTHSFDGELQAGLALPFGWLATTLGVRTFSAEGLDPTVTGFAQLGWQINEHFVVDLHLNLYLPTGDVVVTNGLGAGQSKYLGTGLAGTWWFMKEMGVHLGFEGVTFAESNAATPSLTLGLELRGG
jgi:hypothetical protein